MFREILTSRSIHIGVVFFVVVVGSSLLYSWHVRRTTDTELVPSNALLQQPEKKNKTGTAADTVDTSGVDFEQTDTSAETDDAQATETDNTAALPSEAAAPVDLADAFLPDDFVSEEEPAEDVLISPFGFGPYPEVPPGYPNPNLWDYAEALYEFSPERARDWELRERVCIELWKQGKQSESVAMEDGLVYPCYENTVYVRWDEYIDEDNTPVAYITELLGPASVERYADDFDNDIIPPGITVIPYSEGGIDPYTFLNLN